ncbi:hypothetical protein QJQ45_012217 [Haematococcus lacustris]|nr:hypothetical protein QJQ45_012217 [Haematococcus lacustris]
MTMYRKVPMEFVDEVMELEQVFRKRMDYGHHVALYLAALLDPRYRHKPHNLTIDEVWAAEELAASCQCRAPKAPRHLAGARARCRAFAGMAPHRSTPHGMHPADMRAFTGNCLIQTAPIIGLRGAFLEIQVGTPSELPLPTDPAAQQGPLLLVGHQDLHQRI